MALLDGEPLNLGIRRVSFEDAFATTVTFAVEWRTSDDGWERHAVLVCDPSFGPGDWKCIPGFVPMSPTPCEA